MCNLVKVAIGLLERLSEVFVGELRHTSTVEKTPNLWHAIGHFLVRVWERGLDGPDARRQLESRARRIFNAIMMDRCEEFSRPSSPVDRQTG